MSVRRIVMGVDGSAGSVEALEWALEMATSIGAQVTALIAWEVPIAAASTGRAWPPSVEWPDFQRESSDVLRRIVDEHADDAMEIKQVVVEGPAALTILDEAKDADMVVVGSRGRGGFASLLLGSVSSQVAQHARCPVVIVPTTDTR